MNKNVESLHFGFDDQSSTRDKFGWRFCPTASIIAPKSMSAPTNQGTATAPHEGDVLAGKYRVEKILGKGGMGVVVAAMHLQLGQRVAIKYLFQPDNTEIVARFLREARAAVRLRSQHVARVVDVGELDNGAPYMVMEYLEGEDLQQHVKRLGPMAVTDAVTYLLQTCEAIAEAHAGGIVHRDLKPANLFLSSQPDGTRIIKVLDFGISKTTENEGEGDAMQLTRTSTMLGSPLYMSPEQLKSSRDVDARSDIWALGTILYQLLAGKVPFHCNAYSELVLKVNLDAPPPLSDFRGDVPPALEAVIMKCLEKKRENRWQNVGEFAYALVEFGTVTARLSAEKCAHVLEASGVTVQRLSGTNPPLATTGPAPSNSTMPNAAMTTSGAVASTLATPVDSTGVNSTHGSATKSRTPLFIGLGFATIVAVGAIVSLLRPAATNAIPATASTPAGSAQRPSLDTATSAPVVPVAVPVAPMASAASADAPAQVVTAMAPASSSAAATQSARPVSGTKTPATKSPSSGNNPLNMNPY
jgi:serine/threonine protein kinase